MRNSHFIILKNVGQGHDKTIFVVAPFDGKYPTSYLRAIVMFGLFLPVYQIFINQEKCQNFDLENEVVEVEKQDLRHSTRHVRFHISDFFAQF